MAYPEVLAEDRRGVRTGDFTLLFLLRSRLPDRQSDDLGILEDRKPALSGHFGLGNDDHASRDFDLLGLRFDILHEDVVQGCCSA